jgi:hypothetical protein
MDSLPYLVVGRKLLYHIKQIDRTQVVALVRPHFSVCSTIGAGHKLRRKTVFRKVDPSGKHYR